MPSRRSDTGESGMIVCFWIFLVLVLIGAGLLVRACLDDGEISCGTGSLYVLYLYVFPGLISLAVGCFGLLVLLIIKIARWA